MNINKEMRLRQWAHARRPFAEIVKSLGTEKASGTMAAEALMQIQAIYHADNLLLKLPPSERKNAVNFW